MEWELRYSAHPADAKNYDTERLRNDFLVDGLFNPGKIKVVYSMYDRFIVGGAMPNAEGNKLEPFEELKAQYFLQRREIGFINVGGPAIIKVDDQAYKLDYKEALYLGSGNQNLILFTAYAANPSK
jgi:4-deoxy-L-threo-5-hexosulose-uronate ketol-isomerase